MATSTARIESHQDIASSIFDQIPFKPISLPCVRSALSRKLLALYVFFDLLVIFAVGVGTATLISKLFPAPHGLFVEISHNYIPLLLVQSVLCVSFAALRREYERWPEPGFLNRLTFAAIPCVLSALPLIPVLLEHFDSITKFGILVGLLLEIPALMTMRIALVHFLHIVLQQVDGFHNVVIIGTGPIAQRLAHHIEQNPHLGYLLVGFLDETVSSRSETKLLGSVDDLAYVARQYYIDEIFITVPTDQQKVTRLALMARDQRLNVNVVPETYDDLSWRADVSHALGYPILELHREPISVAGLFSKRLFDIGASLALIVAVLPLATLISLLIKLGSHGPILYVSFRVGKKGHIFKFYKFRTMVQDADQLKSDLLHLNERNGLLFKMRNDPRVTTIGKLLRKFSLDELPQLWNVLKGEMSLVGPRPPVPEEYNRYPLEYLRRMDVRPGITGLWQIYARTDPSFDKYLSFDLEYIENWNLLLDLKILVKTLPAVLEGTGQ